MELVHIMITYQRMNDKRLTIEIELIRITKPLVDEARMSTERIAKQLGQINKIKISTNETVWQEFQNDTYSHLLKMVRIGEEYEERKIRLIDGKHNFKRNYSALFY